MHTTNNLRQTSFLGRLNLWDYAWAFIVAIATTLTFLKYGDKLNIYEQFILVFAAGMLIFIGWVWEQSRTYFGLVALFSLFAVWLYDGKTGGAFSIGMEKINLIANGDGTEENKGTFFLKYLFSSQSAIMWMSALFLMSTVTYWAGLIAKHEFTEKVASTMVWAASIFGGTGIMVRWYESYLVNLSYGHIPVSNLYEVFILFAVMTALMYLYYENRHNNRSMGAFVMTIVSASVVFLLWYSFNREAHQIQPLIAALDSWWMKIHVPANFVGYGGFAIAAGAGVAYLIKHKWGEEAKSTLPALSVLDDVMYRAIALGFAFFTIATVLGAMWAADAWGGYWSWDPKEVWALIVWLNYAAWLHTRLTKGWRDTTMAWWAIIGLFITTFAFIGVNMFLTGFHSYGEL